MIHNKRTWSRQIHIEIENKFCNNFFRRRKDDHHPIAEKIRRRNHESFCGKNEKAGGRSKG